MKTTLVLLMIGSILVGSMTMLTATAIALCGGKFHLLLINLALTGWAWFICVPWANALRKEFR